MIINAIFPATLEPPSLKLQGWYFSFYAMQMLSRGRIYLEHTWFIQKTLVKLQCSTVCCILQTEIDRVDDEMLFLSSWMVVVCICVFVVVGIALWQIFYIHIILNTFYLTDSYISFTLKLESRQNFCSNSLIRSSTYGKKNISDFSPCGSHFLLIHFTY